VEALHRQHHLAAGWRRLEDLHALGNRKDPGVLHRALRESLHFVRAQAGEQRDLG
jgi:hypothetical protein